MSAASPRRFGAVLFFATFLLFVVLGFTPIRSYDYFWHLATGRWIAEHGALPYADPFAVASDRIEWINGSWLFQWLSYVVFEAGGHQLVNVVRIAAVAAAFSTIAQWLARTTGATVAIAVTVLSFAGAAHRLGTRPETAGAICCVFALMLLLREGSSRRETALFTLLTLIWANMHPSALLAPVMSAVVTVVPLLDDRTRSARAGVVRTLLAAAALLVTPHGWKGVVAPFQLAAQVGEGKFVNLEWLPSSPMQFPLLYLAIATGAALLLFSPAREWRRIALLAFFALLAARYVRNHGFFFAVLPLLIAPELARLRSVLTQRRSALLLGGAAVIAAAVTLTLPFDAGVDQDIFPHRSVSTLKALPLQGAIYNPDQFGGFIIWNVYPHRRALTDGRNELHATYISALEKARMDNRSWRAFLTRYGVTAAVEEYRREPLEVVDPRSGQRTPAAPSLAFFPRREWALVDFDEASMLFVKRSAVAASTLAGVEFTELRPDLTSRSEVRDRDRFLEELNRAATEGRATRRLAALAARLSLR